MEPWGTPALTGYSSEDFPSKKDDWKMFEKNNLTIALNILYLKEKEIYAAYISKHNSNHEKANNSLNYSKWRK